MQPLRTKRLELRPCRAEDVDLLHALWIDPDVRRYLWDEVTISRETAAEVVQGFLDSADQAGFGLWMLYERLAEGTPARRDGTQSTVPLGFCSLRQIGGTGEIELLYGLSPSAWGRGLATEASLEVVRYGFDVLGLPRIWARTDPPNVASQRVIQRLGMRPAADPAAENLSLGKTQPRDAPQTVAYVIDWAQFQKRPS